MTTTDHRIDRHMTATGYAASCACGWRVTKRTRDDREREAHGHALADTLVTRTIDRSPA